MRIDSSSRYDASRLPRLREYIDQLPDGLDAHLERKANASVVHARGGLQVRESASLVLTGYRNDRIKYTGRW